MSHVRSALSSMFVHSAHTAGFGSWAFCVLNLLIPSILGLNLPVQVGTSSTQCERRKDFKRSNLYKVLQHKTKGAGQWVLLYRQRISKMCSERMKSVSLCVRVCRLHRVVMDGRWVPADVLFFYKTLPLRTAEQGGACHTCDEWPEGNIFTSDP